MMMTMPLQWGQQHQLEGGNYALATRATSPSQIKGNNAIVTREITPAWGWQGCLNINNGNNTIIMMAKIAIAATPKTPAYWWQGCHHDKGNNASSTMSNKGNDASLTMAEMPAHQWWQWRHCDKSNNCHCKNDKDLCATTATMPSQQGQLHQLDDEQWGLWRMHAHTCKWTYHMLVFAHTLKNISYVQACKPACKPSNPFCCGRVHDK